MKTYLIRFSAVFAILLVSATFKAQTAIISSDPGPGLRIVMSWSPVSGAAGYQIFRKTSAGGAYPATPINPSVIEPLSNCTAIRTLLLNPDSSSWKLLSRGLAKGDTLFDPCTLSSLTPGTQEYTRLLTLAARNIPVAKCAGLAFEDGAVSNGTAYWYRIVAVNGSGSPVSTVADNLNVTAGAVVLPAAPSGIVAEAGDNDILIRWNEQTGAAGYRVFRSITPGGFYQRVNETDYSLRFSNKLNGDTIIPSTPGFLDFQRFDPSGAPVAHDVNGALINGPKNGFTYYYKVQSVDLLGRAGAMSALYVSALPLDKTIPAVPAGVTVIPDETSVNGQIEVRWMHVTVDANGHLETPGVVEYQVYRFEGPGNPDSLPAVLVGGSPVPAPVTGSTVLVTDHSPGLRAVYGDRTWWYRIRAVDNAGNISRWSAAFSGVLKDITHPAIPTGLVTDGFEDHIDMRWTQNTEPDLKSYQVYRSFCHYGDWVPCPDAEGPRDPNCPPADETKNKQPKVCSGPFVFLGEITKDSLTRAMNADHAAFTDRSIPAGSPLCYAYWIKAVDGSGNMSGDYPYPNAAERAQIQCERLRDRTPPEPALISGLFARNHAIRVEWIAPPTQDTRAYHVYRAPEKTPQVEPSENDFVWVGGMTVEKPPVAPVSLTQPYTAAGISTCDQIPVEGTDEMSRGFFTDTKVEDRKVYWYKVVGIDFDGNETPLKFATAVSTFTFQTQTGDAPTFETLVQQPDTCGIRLEWFPIFDPNVHRGFLLYKSMDAAGPFVQATSMLMANTWLDRQVVKGRKYWYKLALVQKDGKLSEIGAPVMSSL